MRAAGGRDARRGAPVKIEGLDPPAERVSSPEDRNRLLAEAIAHAETKEANYRQPSKQGRRTGQWKGPLSLVVLGLSAYIGFASPPWLAEHHSRRFRARSVDEASSPRYRCKHGTSRCSGLGTVAYRALWTRCRYGSPASASCVRTAVSTSWWPHTPTDAHSSTIPPSRTRSLGTSRSAGVPDPAHDALPEGRPKVGREHWRHARASLDPHARFRGTLREVPT